MRFAQSIWLIGTVSAAIVAVLLILGGVFLLRAARRFGDDDRVAALVTGRAGPRRAVKGALTVLAVALAFVALAQPQYGRGTRIIPATNLDVVLVLDYSKSMYARDIAPSRIERAKGEVGRLVRQLPGARFGAVAFAGEPISFPLTSDGGAISQFFRQLSPHDLPVGGTAIGRALEAGRELLQRDPVASKHERVMVLVTDGEDLEGDPDSVADSAAGDGVTIHVVQIGGRSPEPIPDVDESGQSVGWRTDGAGNTLMTALTAEGEAQLSRIAEKTGGSVVRSQRGSTGIDKVAAALRKMMTEELSEKVETVYADVYYYPLALALLLLVVETFLSQVPRRRRRRLKRGAGTSEEATMGWTGAALVVCLGLAGCNTIADRLFERHAPPVDKAIGALDAGDAAAAVELLQQYLSTGQCKDGRIGTPDRVQDHPQASFDLALGLFTIAEEFGQRFSELGQPSADQGTPPDQQSAERQARIDCALAITELAAADATLEPEFQARAHYLTGNLRLLRGDAKSAISAYDRALRLTPGLPADAGDSLGRDAAWNRAIALRLRDQQPPPDAGPDSGPDSGDPDAGPRDAASEPDTGDGKDGDQPDSSPDAADGGGGPRDAGPPDADRDQDSGTPKPQEQDSNRQPESSDGGGNPPPEQKQPEKSEATQDERILDMLEQAPMLQANDPRHRVRRRPYRSTEDK
jgi:Ca-activated chloride channel family protein